MPASSLTPPASRLPHRVAVLGAGWAGMAAAVELSRAGVEVSVFEAARTLGGRARRVDLNGLALDNGAHLLVGAYRETQRLIRLVRGDTAGLRAVPLDLHVHGRFRLRAAALPAPLHLAAAILGARGLPLRERVAMVRFMSRMRRTNFHLDPDTTVDALLRGAGQGEHARRYLWDPLCVAALNTRPEEASARVFLNVLRDALNRTRADSELLLPVEDLSAIFPDAAARYVEAHGGQVLAGCAIEGLRRMPAGFEVRSASGTAAYAQVVCALPPYRVPELLRELAGLEAPLDCIAALRYEPIYTSYLQYPPGIRLPQPMLGFAGGHAQWAFDRGLLCGQHGLVAVVISAHGPHESMDLDTLHAALHAELAGALPALQAPPLWARTIAERRATFACTPGLQRPEQSTPVPGLYLAGDYTRSPYPGTLEAAVRSGVACAELAIACARDRSVARRADAGA